MICDYCAAGDGEVTGIAIATRARSIQFMYSKVFLVAKLHKRRRSYYLCCGWWLGLRVCLVKCFTILFDKIERLLSDVYIYGMRTS